MVSLLNTDREVVQYLKKIEYTDSSSSIKLLTSDALTEVGHDELALIFGGLSKFLAVYMTKVVNFSLK